jgi:hypothetical protein
VLTQIMATAPAICAGHHAADPIAAATRARHGNKRVSRAPAKRPAAIAGHWCTTDIFEDMLQTLYCMGRGRDSTSSDSSVAQAGAHKGKPIFKQCGAPPGRSAPCRQSRTRRAPPAQPCPATDEREGEGGRESESGRERESARARERERRHTTQIAVPRAARRIPSRGCVDRGGFIGSPCLGVCTHCDPINSETVWTTLPPRTAIAAALARGTCTHPHVLRLRHALA